MKKQVSRSKKNNNIWQAQEAKAKFLQVSLVGGKLIGESRQRGNYIPVSDGLIAATAIVNHRAVVSENIRGFVETGARLFNPWLD